MVLYCLKLIPVTVSLNASGMQAANANAAATTGTGDVVGQTRDATVAQQALPSLISVEVLGYGGGDEDDRKGPNVPESGASS